MMPRQVSKRIREGIRLAVAPWLIFAWGCTNSVIRPQSPDEVDLGAAETGTVYIEDVAVAHGTHSVQIESVALVTNLRGTGSDPAPSPNRAALMDEMSRLGVRNPNHLLSSPETALVLVRGFLRPGIQKGDRFDVEVRLPSSSEATSLRGGWLMETRMKHMQALGGSIRESNLLAMAQGPILVAPSAEETNDPVILKRGKVLNGGVATESRKLGLLIRRNPSIPVSKQIGDSINRRFHSFTHGIKRGVATPKTDRYVELDVHPRYKDNLARYIQAVRALPIRESPTERQLRVASLERQLLDPVTSASAAIRLEAVGKEALEALRKGIASSDREVRFYAAEALAYLDDDAAAQPLAEAARDVPAFRLYALAALGAMDDLAAYQELVKLLQEPSAETRYGAFRALWTMRGQVDPVIKGEDMDGQFFLHVLKVPGPPLIHVTRSFRPEIVLFGGDVPLHAPVVLEAGNEIVVRDAKDGQLVVSRFSLDPDREDKEVFAAPTVRDLIRALVDVGGTYPDVVQALQMARESNALEARLEIDAVPRPGRTYLRNSGVSGSTQAAEPEADSPLPNLFSFEDDEEDK